MLCAECNESVGLTFQEDYLCDDCRCDRDGLRKCTFVDGENFKCGRRYVDDGNDRCEKCRKLHNCDYCSKTYSTHNEGRFMGLCYDCKAIARKSAPLKEEHVVGECSECEYEAYSACCDALVYATIV